MRRSMACVALVAAGTFAFSVLAVSPAENFPEKPIKLIVPFGPGGPPDVAARIIGAYLSDHLGPVVVENHHQSAGSGEERQGAGRVYQGQSGQAQLRRGDRHAAAHVRRNV